MIIFERNKNIKTTSKLRVGVFRIKSYKIKNHARTKNKKEYINYGNPLPLLINLTDPHLYLAKYMWEKENCILVSEDETIPLSRIMEELGNRPVEWNNKFYYLNR